MGRMGEEEVIVCGKRRARTANILIFVTNLKFIHMFLKVQWDYNSINPSQMKNIISQKCI
jgi:hypothetical protein